MAKSPKKPRRGGEHDPAVNTAAGAPSKGVSVDPTVNTAAGAPSNGVEGHRPSLGCWRLAAAGCRCGGLLAKDLTDEVLLLISRGGGHRGPAGGAGAEMRPSAENPVRGVPRTLASGGVVVAMPLVS